MRFETFSALLCFLSFTLAHFYFESGNTIIPKPGKLNIIGEDALYTEDQLLTLSDGVGSWADEGVDCSLYSNKLMSNIHNFFPEKKEEYTAEPKKLLIRAAEEDHEIGSATLVITILDPKTGLLRTAYIGDSGYLILRRVPDQETFEIIFRSEDQQKEFNFPYQLGVNGMSPDLALTFEHDTQAGDIVILGSDGLLDNLYDEMILKALHLFSELPLAYTADFLANLAFKLSLDPNYKSPFTIAGQAAGEHHKGGKSDDIAVIVARIMKK